MEEERTEQPADNESTQDASAGESREADASADLAQEINKLAEAISVAAQNAWNSEQRHQLEQDLRRGLSTLVENVEGALSRFNASEEGKEIREQAEKVVEKVRTSSLAAELKEGLAKGIQTAASEVRKFAEDMDEKPDNSDDAQDIPVERGDDKAG